jgi:hypothetical protein
VFILFSLDMQSTCWADGVLDRLNMLLASNAIPEEVPEHGE